MTSWKGSELALAFNHILMIQDGRQGNRGPPGAFNGRSNGNRKDNKQGARFNQSRTSNFNSNESSQSFPPIGWLPIIIWLLTCPHWSSPQFPCSYPGWQRMAVTVTTLAVEIGRSRLVETRALLLSLRLPFERPLKHLWSSVPWRPSWIIKNVIKR